jgi:hypothetical protein
VELTPRGYYLMVVVTREFFAGVIIAREQRLSLAAAPLRQKEAAFAAAV